MQRYGFKPSDDGKFSKFQEWDEGDLCLHTEALAEIYSIKNGFDATLAEKDATIASLQVENEVLREQNLMMNKSGVEKSATIAALQERVKELEGV